MERWLYIFMTFLRTLSNLRTLYIFFASMHKFINLKFPTFCSFIEMKKWNIKPRSCWEWNFVGFNTVSEIHDTRRVNSHLSFIFVVVFFVIFHRCASPDRSTTTLNIPTFTFFSLLFTQSQSRLSRVMCDILTVCQCDEKCSFIRHATTIVTQPRRPSRWPPSEPSHERVN